MAGNSKTETVSDTTSEDDIVVAQITHHNGVKLDENILLHKH